LQKITNQGIKMSKEIIYIAAPLCPKCVRVNRWLKEMEATHPDIQVTKYNFAFQFKEVKKYNIKTIPTLIIGEEKLGGWIAEEDFKTAIEKLK